MALVRFIGVAALMGLFIGAAGSCRGRSRDGGGASGGNAHSASPAIDPTRQAAANSGANDAGGPFCVLPRESPSDVVRGLHEAHMRGAYSEIAKRLIPGTETGALNLLMVIDDVLAANDRLQEMAGDRLNGAVQRNWDMSIMGSNLGPYSREIRIIGESIDGNSAIVTLQEGKHVPLYHANLELIGGRWLLRPESYSAKMVPELKRLARMLRDVANEVERGAGLRFVDETFVYRIIPQIQRISELDDNDATLAAASAE